MNTQEGGEFTRKEKKSFKSISSWIENKDWEKDSASLQRVKDIEKFVKDLPQNESGINLPQSFSIDYFIEFLLNHDRRRKDYELIKNKFKDTTVVDLGAGDSVAIHHLLPYLTEMEIKEYIAVEKFYGNKQEDAPEPMENTDMGGNVIDSKMKSYRINSDMFIFISKLPDNSCNFIMNGIDHYVIHNDKYWEKLSQELHRVTLELGIITGYGSNVPSSNFKDIRIEPSPGKLILEKISSSK